MIGVARTTWRDGAPEPLAMWEQVARDAAADSGARRDPLAVVDDLGLVHCQSWTYDDPTERLAERLALGPGNREVSVLAGTAPQRLVNAAAERMLAGESRLALVVGGEALATRARLRRGGEAPRWSFPHPRPPDLPLDLDEWMLPTELAHGVLPAWLTFALLDQARGAARESPAPEYRLELGTLLARCSEVAAANPHAWFRSARTAAEITVPGSDNRMVADPYTKLMTAFMDVDMAAGILLATHEEAERLGVPPDRRVYLRGWAFALDAKHLAARADLTRSAAMGVAARAALDAAGVTVDDIAAFDLYSCFSAALGFAGDALGIAPTDSRPVTVTGGLPYHGGPSANYMGHSIGHMVDQLRAEPGALGLLNGIGMHMTKHVWACYSARPGPVRPPDYAALQSAVDRRHSARVVAAEAIGPARIASATAVYDHDSTPAWALAICDLPDGQRAYARSDNPDVLHALAGDRWIERTVELRAGTAGTNAIWL